MFVAHETARMTSPELSMSTAHVLLRHTNIYIYIGPVTGVLFCSVFTHVYAAFVFAARIHVATTITVVKKKSRAPATLILCTCRPQSLVCFQVKKRRTWARHAKIESCLPQLIHHSTRTARIQSTISQSSWTGSGTGTPDQVLQSSAAWWLR